MVGVNWSLLVLCLLVGGEFLFSARLADQRESLTCIFTGIIVCDYCWNKSPLFLFAAILLSRCISTYLLCLYYINSLHFMGHFPGGPGLVGTWMSPFWILLELRVMEVVVTTGAIRRAKLQSKCNHQHPVLYFTDWMPFPLPNQHCQNIGGKFILYKLYLCYSVIFSKEQPWLGG